MLWVALRDALFDALFALRFVGVVVVAFFAAFSAVFFPVLLDRLRAAAALPLAVFWAAGFFEDFVSVGVACCMA